MAFALPFHDVKRWNTHQLVKQMSSAFDEFGCFNSVWGQGYQPSPTTSSKLSLKGGSVVSLVKMKSRTLFNAKRENVYKKEKTLFDKPLTFFNKGFNVDDEKKLNTCCSSLSQHKELHA